jgi:hypothetical protein
VSPSCDTPTAPIPSLPTCPTCINTPNATVLSNYQNNLWTPVPKFYAKPCSQHQAGRVKELDCIVNPFAAYSRFSPEMACVGEMIPYCTQVTSAAFASPMFPWNVLLIVNGHVVNAGESRDENTVMSSIRTVWTS